MTEKTWNTSTEKPEKVWLSWGWTFFLDDSILFLLEISKIFEQKSCQARYVLIVQPISMICHPRTVTDRSKLFQNSYALAFPSASPRILRLYRISYRLSWDYHVENFLFLINLLCVLFVLGTAVKQQQRNAWKSTGTATTTDNLKNFIFSLLSELHSLFYPNSYPFPHFFISTVPFFSCIIRVFPYHSYFCCIINIFSSNKRCIKVIHIYSFHSIRNLVDVERVARMQHQSNA